MAARVPIREGQAFLRLAMGEPEFAGLLEVDEMLRMAVEFLPAFHDELDCLPRA
ncbi:hypothetical protein [Hamadaea tsunoensis]|uniref:hypothetical protein n=1 Tax=Hamadaea tsunoensis TaxID=53368 RepID=UPI000409F5B4|nr:hypothetical protein [Hamadaea tsunoensis]